LEKLKQDWQRGAESEYSANLSFLQSIRGKVEWDKRAKQVHAEVFSEADCLSCANCCKTTPALVTRSDAKRIAKHLGLPPKTFIRKYLLEDVNGEMMIQRVPCTFLNENNTCEIYEVRPQACREYPHTDQKDFHRRSKLNAKNTIVCPAAFAIVERLRTIEKDFV